MFSKLTYKQKFYVLLSGAALMLWLSIELAFNRTIDLKQQLDQRQEQLAGIQDAPYQLKALTSRLEEMERLIGDASGEDASPYLIEKAGSYCESNGLILTEIPRKHSFRKEEYTLVTYKLVIQGAFKKLLKLCDEFEQFPEAGKLRAVSFEADYNLRKGRKELFGIYYIQSVENLH